MLPEVAAVVAGICNGEFTWKNEPGDPLWLKIRNEFGFVPAARKPCAVQLSDAADVPFQYDPFHDSATDPKLLPEVAVPVAGSVGLPINEGLLIVTPEELIVTSLVPAD